MRKKETLLGAAMALAICLVPALATAKVVKLGVLAPISGEASADGQEMVNGAQMAVDELNAAGGIDNYTFKLVVGDVVDGNAGAVTTAAERLLGDRAMGAIFTGYASGSNFEIETMAEHDMIYMLAGGSAQTRDIISPKPKDFGTVWSYTPSYDGYNTEIVPVITGLVESGKLALPNKKVAIISSDNPYSKGIADGMATAFKKAGWTITENELLPSGAINDWRGFLAKVRQNPPAILINTDYLPANAAAFMSQFMEQPTNSLVFIQYAPSVPEFLKLTKKNSSGVVYNSLSGVLPVTSSPRAKKIVGKYAARFGNEPGTYGVALYEEVMVYADALTTVGDPTKHTAIGVAIGATDKQTAMGRLIFDPATHLSVQSSDTFPLLFYQIVDGKRVLFYPDAYATGKFTRPRWMK